MLPKFDEVAISTYLMVFAKMRRPSMTPSASTPRSLSSSTMSAASLATSVAESTEMPTSAACSATASLTPSPRNATSTPRAARELDQPRLLLGPDPGEDRRARDRGGERVVVERVELGAGQRRRRPSRPMSRQTLPATVPLSPVMIFTSMPSASQLGDRGAGVGLRPVDEREEAGEAQVALVGRRRVASSPVAGAVATATTRAPSANSRSSVACASAGDVAAAREHRLGRALRDRAVARRPVARTTTDASWRSWSNGSSPSRW